MSDAHGDLKREENRCFAYVGFLEAFIDYIKKPLEKNWKQIEIKILDATDYISKEEYFEFKFQKSIEIFDRLKEKAKLLKNLDFQESKKFISAVNPYGKFSKKIKDFIEEITPEE